MSNSNGSDTHAEPRLARMAHAAQSAEQISDAFFGLDSEWRFASVNQRAEQMLKHSRAELLGQRVWDIFPEARGTEFQRQYEHAVRDGVPVQFEAHYPPLSLWLEVRAFPAPLGLAVYFCDIGARKNAEVRLAEQASLLDQARDAILVRDLAGTITYCNKSAERLYGWNAGEAIGSQFDDLLGGDVEGNQSAAQAVQENHGWIGELRQRSRDGRMLEVESRWTLVIDAAGAPKSILIINTDVTVRKDLERQFLRAQRMESIGRLAGGIAHDLNNVLAPILMSIGVLKQGETDADRLETMAAIEESGWRAAELVKRVLSFARGVDGRRLELDLRHIINDVEKIARETFSKNIRLYVHAPCNLGLVRGDPTQLHQVLLNLSVNARDAMPQGGTLTIAAENVILDGYETGLGAPALAGPYVMVLVEDTGTGIPGEIIDKIFEPFFTTKEVGKGTGLGLSTTLGIVASHDGFVTVSSEPGKGSRFRVYLPAREGSRAVTVPAAAVELPRGSGELVLIIEDEATIRQVARHALEAHGYRVLFATDGADGVAVFARQKAEIDLVLLDMVMPNMDGPATLAVLKRLRPDVPVVAMSGLFHEDAKPIPGVKRCLPKPFSIEGLLTALHDVLRGPSAEQ